jgi:hypothetical protein
VVRWDRPADARLGEKVESLGRRTVQAARGAEGIGEVDQFLERTLREPPKIIFVTKVARDSMTVIG